MKLGNIEPITNRTTDELPRVSRSSPVHGHRQRSTPRRLVGLLTVAAAIVGAGCSAGSDNAAFPADVLSSSPTSQTETATIATPPVSEPLVTEPLVTEPPVTDAPPATDAPSTSDSAALAVQSAAPAEDADVSGVQPATLPVTIEQFVGAWNITASGVTSLTLVGAEQERASTDDGFDERTWFGSILNGTQVLIAALDDGDVLEVYVSIPRSALDVDENWTRAMTLAVAAAASNVDSQSAVTVLRDVLAERPEPPIEGASDDVHFCIFPIDEQSASGFPPGFLVRLDPVALDRACDLAAPLVDRP